ncbi:DEAD/DEAH box helicase [Streptomyces sp. 1331.2]|uniref:DEAD/DEAH box helicase n=1 Tax=Streptomyces sp. 1331.2 TaxID=1938835 RepID=UPI000BCD5B45|nr:DEAD/DEAH box helicase [Streptomyces sp. 1331.2]SOB83372.1 Superfamily II DNA or RNA helicase, SNF2 family [Streptomyces sp. 1331.2]
MFVLHALWRADGQLALWAEDARAHPGAAGPQPDRPAPRAHPYACPAAELAAVLGGIGPGLGWLAGQAPERWATLLLPTVGAAPAPSPDLPVTPPRGGAVLAPWRVPALLFDAGAAAQLLGEVFDPQWAVTGTDLPGTGRVEVVHGPSLRWLTGVHDLAWRTVGRGRVLPVPVLADARPQARWRPDPTPAGRREAAALAAGCPPVLLGEWPHGAGTGEALLDSALEALVDAEARAALAHRRSPFPEPGETVTERWLYALATPDGALDGLPPADSGSDGSDGSDGSAEFAEFAELRRRVAAWYAAAEPADPALRLCFRLVEPLGPDPDDPEGRPSDDAWQLEFLLQAVDEPSLLIRAAELHEGGAGYAALARKTGDPAVGPAADPVAVLVAQLARAAHRWPDLDGLRHRSRPSALPLDRAGALDFLRTAAPALAEDGFGVLLPAWWRRRPRLGLALRATTPPAPGSLATTSQVDRDAVVAFRWQAALGPDGAPLTEQELAELAAAKQGLVRVRGAWLEADPAQIAAALAFLADRRDGVLAAADLLRLALDPQATVAGLPVTSVRADGPLGDLLAGRADAAPAPVLPPDFRAVLRPYQERGLAWLRTMSGLGLGAVLADDMGLGKTVQTLALLAAEQAEAAGRTAQADTAEGAPGPTLLVCPMSLVGNWQREAERFAPALRRYVHHGSGRLGADRLAEAVRGADLVITTYGLVQRDLTALRTIRWRRVVADEAQHIKNTGTAQSRAIRALPVTRHRIALTGTPVENRLSELHAVLDFANPGLLGPAERFKERYAIPVELHRSPERTAELRRRTAPFVLRRLKSDPVVAAELPAKQEMTVWCNLTAEQAGLYQAVVADLLRRVEGIKGVERRGTVLAAIGKLKQVCNHPAQLLHDGSALGERSGKVARLAELLEEALAEGDRTLVFTQYAEFGTMLRPYLERRLGEDVLYLHGGLSRARREELVERFQSPDGPRVFLLSLRAGGTGLNLTAANQVIHLDRWWNPAVEEQATDRAFRIGQRRDVQVRRLVCVGTVEERIDELLAAKRSLAETVVGEGEHWLTDLPLGALRELVALTREDAVAEEDA